MNIDSIATLNAHLDQRENRIREAITADYLKNSDHAAALRTMAERLRERFHAEVIPELESAVSLLSARGYHALVTVGDDRKDPVGNWTIVVTVKFDCGDTRMPQRIYDLTFIGEVSPPDDSWRVRSFSLGPGGCAIPEETFLPGTSALKSFVASRVTALIKTAFPIPT